MRAAVISVAVEVEEHGFRHAAPQVLQRLPIEAGVDIEVFVQSFQQTPAVLRRAADQLGFLYRCVCHYREPKQKAESRIMMPRHRPSPPLNSDAPKDATRIQAKLISPVLSRTKDAFNDQ